jgi:hypothetical protein
VSTSTDSVESCACDGASSASGQRVDAHGDGAFSFSQVIRGAAADADGDPAWPFSLLQWGDVGADDGRLDIRLTLSSIDGDFLYAGQGVFVEAVDLGDGAVQYRFDGTFNLSAPDEPAPGLPARGFFVATLSVWQDGTIYAGSLSLSDAQV